MRARVWRVGGRDRGVFIQPAEHEHRHLSLLLHRSPGHGNRCVKASASCRVSRGEIRSYFMRFAFHYRATRAEGTQKSGGPPKQDRQLPQRSSDVQWRRIESSQLPVKTLGKAP